MRKLIRLYHGKRIEGKLCKYCDMKRDGIVMRQDFYWRYRLDCGHEIGGSYCLPPSELIRLGIVNRNDGAPDPRTIAATNVFLEDAKRQWKQNKERRWIENNLAGNKKYL